MNLNTIISFALVGKANKANEGKKEITCTLFPNEEKEGKERKGKGRKEEREGRNAVLSLPFADSAGLPNGSNKCHSRIPSFSPPLSFGWVRSPVGNKRFVASILSPTIIVAIVVVVFRTAS